MVDGELKQRNLAPVRYDPECKRSGWGGTGGFVVDGIRCLGHDGDPSDFATPRIPMENSQQFLLFMNCLAYLGVEFMFPTLLDIASSLSKAELIVKASFSSRHALISGVKLTIRVPWPHWDPDDAFSYGLSRHYTDPVQDWIKNRLGMKYTGGFNNDIDNFEVKFPQGTGKSTVERFVGTVVENFRKFVFSEGTLKVTWKSASGK